MANLSIECDKYAASMESIYTPLKQNSRSPVLSFCTGLLYSPYFSL